MFTSSLSSHCLLGVRRSKLMERFGTYVLNINKIQVMSYYKVCVIYDL